MKANSKKLVLILFTFLLIMSAGCGKSGESKVPEKEFVYLPEYVTLDMECDYIDKVVANQDALFFAGSTYNEETQEQKKYIYRYSIADNTCEELALDIPKESYISEALINQAGNLSMLVNIYASDAAEGEEPINPQNTFELWEVSAENGQVLNTQDLSPLITAAGMEYVQYFSMDQAGNYYLSSGEQSIMVADQDLKKICDFQVSSWINEMVVSKEGDVYISMYGTEGIELHKLDLTTKSLGEKVPGVTGYNNQSFYKGVNKSFLFNNGDTICLLDTTTGTSEELFNWMDSDINSNEISNVGELSDGRIWAITESHDADSSKKELILLTKTKASEVKQKEVITYGTLWLDYELRKSIIDFNKTNEEYHISVKEYGTDDYEAGLTQFNADITSNNCPDMIDLSNVNFSQYASKGIFEDLYPFMEKSGLNPDDYQENILKAYEDDGKLYGIMSQFYIVTTAAKASKVGDKSGWTLSEMLDFAESVNPGYLMEYGSQPSIFYYCIYNNIDEFINWETGECSFEGEDFIRTLEFAAKFPAESDYNEEQESTSAALNADHLFLMQTSISSVQEYQMMEGLFGEKITFIGFPNKEAKGNLIQPASGSIAMASKSKNKEAVWAFISNMISEESQNALVEVNGGSWGFPIHKGALEKSFAKDMEPEYFTDETGKQIEQPKTSWGFNDFQMDIYAAKQEDVDGVKAVINSAEILAGNINEQLVNIITEETKPFFAGQKSAAEVADVVQNRIQIYVNENR